MAYKLTAPIEKTFKLLQIDPDGDTTVRIKQATRSAQEARMDLSAEATRIWNDDAFGEVQVKQRISMAELHRLEVWCTLVDCNILDEGSTEKTEKPLFLFKNNRQGQQYLAMTQAEFGRAWGKLPDEIAEEIHSKVIELNPQWGSGSGE